MLIKVQDKEIYFEKLPNFENDWRCGDINIALQQPMKQQALDGSLHCPDHLCGLDNGTPAAAGPLITPSENVPTHLSNGCPTA